MLSILISLFAPGGWVILAGPFYGVTGPLQWLLGKRYDRLKQAAIESMPPVTEDRLPAGVPG